MHFINVKGILSSKNGENQIGIYPEHASVEYFAKDPVEYKTEKGTICIPYGKVDTDLIYRIAKWCMDTGKHICGAGFRF